MKLIETIERYNELTTEGRNLSHFCTNCYMLSNEVRKKIENRVLYEDCANGIVMILEKREGAWQLYYYMSPDQVKDKLIYPMPLVTELVFNGSKSESNVAEMECLRRLGFRFGREVNRMRSSAKNAVVGDSDEVMIACEADLDGIEELIKSNFDQRFVRLNCRERILADIQNERVFVVRKNEIVVGVLCSERKKNSVSIRQIVVSGEYRRKGYASQLISFYHQAYRENVCCFTHWVVKGNLPAIQFYRKFGYDFDGRCAEEYFI